MSTSSSIPFDAAAWALERGAKYPFDADDDGNAGAAPDWAHAAARAVLYDLCDRRGIKHGFQGIDAPIRKEIIEALAAIIRIANRAGETQA